MAKAANPTWPLSLAEVAPRSSLSISQTSEPDWLTLPARPGIAVFEDTNGRAILIATTADLRELARRRLGAPDAQDHKADYRAVTARVLAIEACSALEADALYLHEARDRMPDTHRVVSERWRAWFLHVDPDAAHPQWTKTNLLGLVAPRSASTPRGAQSPGLPRGLLIGPIADKDTAGRLIERTIDAFDLCRFHHLLVQAPRAAACAYKEMGRCAAPCDGTESLDRYEVRTLAAARYLTGDRESLKGAMQAQMSAAAAEHEFERAAAMKQTFDRLQSLDAPAFSHLAELSSWRLVLVMPSSKPQVVGCLLFAGATLAHLGELRLNTEAAEQAAVLARAALNACACAPVIDPTSEQIDTIAVVSRWLHTAKGRRRGEALALQEGADPALLAQDLLAAAARVAKPKAAKSAAPTVEERELEVLPGSGLAHSAGAASESDPVGTE